MAVHTHHPVSAPPAPPVRERTGELLLRAWCVFVLFTTMAGTAWVLATGEIVTTVVAIASGIVSGIVWIVTRPPVQWRRLPWFAVAYVLFALASILWSAWPATTAVTLLLMVLAGKRYVPVGVHIPLLSFGAALLLYARIHVKELPGKHDDDRKAYRDKVVAVFFHHSFLERVSRERPDFARPLIRSISKCSSTANSVFSTSLRATIT
jgi:hypothetical protein